MIVRVLLNFVCNTIFVYTLPQSFMTWESLVSSCFIIVFSPCWFSLTRLKCLIFSLLLCRFASSGRKLQLLLSDLVI